MKPYETNVVYLQSDRQGLVREEGGERGQQDRHKSTCRLFSFFFSFYKIVFCFASVGGKGVDYYYFYLFNTFIET